MSDAFLWQAIELARDNVRRGEEPFGAVAVRNGEVIATGVNEIGALNDPTAHAEIQAVREACRRLGTPDMAGCVVYASGEPCPMCLAALYWANVTEVWYAAPAAEAARVGLDSSDAYRQFTLPPEARRVRLRHLDLEGASEPFTLWAERTDAPGR